MRRRAKRLEVSTFPFLAVLLCAMGSLILVLIIMDRKAKLAARYKAAEAQAQVADELAARRQSLKQREQDALAAWELKRDAVHTDAVNQQQSLQGQLRNVQEQLAEAAARLKAELDRGDDLQRRMIEVRTQLTTQEQALAASREALAQSTAQTEAERAAKAKMTADLLQLEAALRDLKEARERDRQTFSVVPYNGKSGGNRRPLYIECTSRGVVFHPDRMAVLVDRDPAPVRAEVERRIAQQKAYLASIKANTDGRPYLMLLVRPDGISSYYGLQNAVHGIDLEFGYEFVDANWVLDFSKIPDGPGQLANAGSSGGVAPATGNQGGGHTGLLVANAGQPQGTGNSATSGGPYPVSPGLMGEGVGRGSGEPTVGPGALGSGGAMANGQSGSVGSTGPNAPPLGGAAFGVRPLGSNGPDIGAQPLPPWVPATNGSSAGGRPRVGGSIVTDFASQGDRGTGQPGYGVGPSSPAGNGTATSQGSNPTTATTGGGGQSSPAGHGNGSGQGSIPTTPSVQGVTPRPTGIGNAITQGGNPPTANTSGAPSPNPGNGNGAPQGSTSTTSSTAGLPWSVASKDKDKSGNDGQPMNPGDKPEKDDTPRFAPPPPAKRQPPPLRAARLNGDRDYIIFIDCLADDVVLYPSRQMFSTQSLAQGSPALAKAIQQMIDRKQSLVRPGELPYRPQIRFLVHQESIRTYHSTYPCLTGLNVPQTRQNLDADDDVQRIVTGN